jgi:enolase-phosphatase E1
MDIRYVLTDIEGTTTDVRFVHQTLFPDAYERMAGFVALRGREPEVAAALREVADTLTAEGSPAADEQDLTAALRAWIQADRKHPALKRIQGILWAEGYAQGRLRGHVYPDVPPALKRWQEAGLQMGVYSSGSVQAQQLLFGHSIAGDLTPLFSHYFDTAVGHKQEVVSYARIALAIGLPPPAILFLSDVPAELDAAREAGMRACLLVRGEAPVQGEIGHPIAFNFSKLPFMGVE